MKNLLMKKSVLIVDDEWRTLNGEAERVKASGLPLEVVGLAESGEQALSLSAALRPDIILCDIRMPGMDGISFTIAVKELLPHAAIIFISGFSEKEYLRTAIRLGAVDYLYKPVNDREFHDALSRAIRKCDEAGAQAREPLLDAAQFQALLEGDVPMPGVELGESVILVASHGDAPRTEITRQRLHLFALHMISMLQADRRFRYAALHEHERAVALLSRAPAGDAPPIEHLAAQLCDALLAQFPEGEVSMGVGGGFRAPGHLRRSHREALDALTLRFYRGHGRAYLHSDRRGARYEPDAAQLSRIGESLQLGELPRAQQQLDQLFARFSENERTPEGAVRAALSHVLAALDAAYARRFPGEVLLGAEERERVLRLGTLAQLRAGAGAALDRFSDAIVSRDKGNSAIFGAKRYIWAHVGGDVSLKAIAAHVYLSPTYLCALFKEVTGQTINQYVQQARIERAKAMMAETDSTIAEIAEAVGYRDARYFTKVFIAATQAHPSAYRRSMRHAE